MKTTIEISDAVLDVAKKLAARDGTTIKAMVELGLRMVIKERSGGQPFRLRRASFKGDGTGDPITQKDWAEVQREIYGDRGG